MLQEICFTTCLWIGLFITIYYTLYNIENSRVITNQIVSFIHSFVISILSYQVAIIKNRQGYFQFQNLGELHTKEHEYILYIIGGYMLYDLGYILFLSKKSKFDFIYIIHHLFVFFASLCSIYYGKGGYELVLFIYLAESTTPLLNIKFLLRHFHWHHTFLYKLNDIVFSLRFLFNRNIWYNALIFNTIFYSNTIMVIKLFGFLFIGIHWLWSFYIVKLIYRTIFPRAKTE